MTVYGGDDRLLQIQKRKYDTLGIDERQPHFTLLKGVLHLLQVAAGGKHFAGAGQDNDIGFIVVLDVEKDPREFLVQAIVDRV